VLVSSPSLPYIGKGRWAIPTNLLKGKEVHSILQELCIKAQTKIETSSTSRTPTHNPQILFKELKQDIIRAMRQLARSLVPKIQKTIQLKQAKLEKILNDSSLDSEQQQIVALELEEEIATLEKSAFSTKRLHVAARNRLEGETVSKYWTNINKDKTPRDNFHMIKHLNIDPQDMRGTHKGWLSWQGTTTMIYRQKILLQRQDRQWQAL
jgi:hypothetical protein